MDSIKILFFYSRLIGSIYITGSNLYEVFSMHDSNDYWKAIPKQKK